MSPTDKADCLPTDEALCNSTDVEFCASLVVDFSALSFDTISCGQATSLVGDPKETKERNLLIPQEVVKNTQDITMQLKSLLP
ncbi:MAG: hypothetical protein Q8832_02770, partial [Candidatus Phytoplasma australasiaticum]|nr:hypothetical protein [Candidatus Phytoplasma australasiaticum]